VWRIEITELGYLAPLKDRKGGVRGAPRSAFDVYLTRIGSGGQTAGYCRHENAIHNRRGREARPSYCVLDNDFNEFARRGLSASDVRKATAAHEFFHAIQDGYDAIDEPGWLTEGTAVWMEGEAYPGIRARDLFLDESPLTDPDVPLDASDRYPNRADYSGFQYGAWVFWQFLSESQSPAVIQKVWDSARTGTAYSSRTCRRSSGRRRCHDRLDVPRALDAALGSFGDTFAEFGVWNYAIAPGFYLDGSDYLRVILGRAPLDASYVLDSARTSTATPGRPPESLNVAPLATGYVGIGHDNRGSCTVHIATRLPTHTSRSVLVRGPSGFRDLGEVRTVSLGPGESAILILSNAGNARAAIGYHAGTSAARCS
jgi:hypothetical protein